MITVVAASQNPVKQLAVREAFSQAFPLQDIKVVGVNAASGVADQPMTDGATLQGAINRAHNARTLHPDAQFWVGLEGGVDECPVSGMQSFGWMHILSPEREQSCRSASFPLPTAAVKALKAGEELGPVMDQLFHEHNSRQKGGAVGLLTNELVSRKDLYVQPLIFALVPFLHPGRF